MEDNIPIVGYCNYCKEKIKQGVAYVTDQYQCLYHMDCFVYEETCTKDTGDSSYYGL